jgi:ATP-dependent Clp protease ATP-binding subunit ClpX
MFRRTQSGEPAVHRCSFCRKSQDDVSKLIAGVSANICDECVDVCLDIMRDDRQFAASPQVEDGAHAKDAPQ